MVFYYTVLKSDVLKSDGIFCELRIISYWSNRQTVKRCVTIPLQTVRDVQSTQIKSNQPHWTKVNWTEPEMWSDAHRNTSFCCCFHLFCCCFRFWFSSSSSLRRIKSKALSTAHFFFLTGAVWYDVYVFKLILGLI